MLALVGVDKAFFFSFAFAEPVAMMYVARLDILQALKRHHYALIHGERVSAIPSKDRLRLYPSGSTKRRCVSVLQVEEEEKLVGSYEVMNTVY
jgi:hypothetical protein